MKNIIRQLDILDRNLKNIDLITIDGKEYSNLNRTGKRRIQKIVESLTRDVKQLIVAYNSKE